MSAVRKRCNSFLFVRSHMLEDFSTWFNGRTLMFIITSTGIMPKSAETCLISFQAGRGLILLLRNVGVHSFMGVINRILGKDAPVNFLL